LIFVISTFTDPPRFWQQIAALTALLAMLFAALQPPPTAHLGFFMALSAWAAHIGLGMLCALLAIRLLLGLRPGLGRRPWTALVLSGLAGATLFAPIALGLEALLPAPPPEPADDWLDTWEAAGGARALAAEWLALLPSYLPAWLLINAMPMLQVSQPQLSLAAPPRDAEDVIERAAVRSDDRADRDNRADARLRNACSADPDPEAGLDRPINADAQGDADADAHSKADAHADDLPATSRVNHARSQFDPQPPVPDPTQASHAERADAIEGLLDRLPLAIGRQLVSITSDLHYLQVVTRRGRATVLGSLSEAEAELGARGLRIHRSHWVALDAVRRLRRGAQGWRCELHDGRSMPVSRRRAAEIKLQLGTDFVVE
jgi:hypothetical protein